MSLDKRFMNPTLWERVVDAAHAVWAVVLVLFIYVGLPLGLLVALVFAVRFAWELAGMVLR